MENHPIPQDITGFQFKLIGNMTVKQFIYLASGTVIAWFCFFILPVHFLIRFPLALIFLLLGISLAFVPIDGRPMDVMIVNLIKAVFAPTKYIYKKTGGNLSSPQPQPVLGSTQQVPQPSEAGSSSARQITQDQPTVTAEPSTPPQAPVVSIDSALPTSDSGKVIELNDLQTMPQPLMNLDDEEEEQKTKEILENEKKLEEETEKADAPIAAQSEVHQKAIELEKLLTQITRQKEALEKELLVLKSKLNSQQQEKFSPGVATPLKQTQRVRQVPAGMEKAVGVPATPQDPNLIVGIVKDPRGNPLPNILVEVKDLEDNPVRAFKTNGLGQFASATSLSNGRYIVTFDDPTGTNKFDAVEIEATGAPIMPLEIISVDKREELRRELFN